MKEKKAEETESAIDELFKKVWAKPRKPRKKKKPFGWVALDPETGKLISSEFFSEYRTPEEKQLLAKYIEKERKKLGIKKSSSR